MKDKRFWIIIIALIVWLLFSVFMFIYFRNVCKIAKENPLEYGAKEYDIDQCICFTESGNQFYFNKTRVWYVKGFKATRGFDPGNVTEKLDSLNLTN